MLRLGSLSGLILLLAAGPAAATKLHYDVYVGGIKAARVTAHIGLDGTRYATAVQASTQGMTDWLLGWRMSSIAEGERGEGGMTPAFHRSVSKFRGEDRAVDVRFEAGRIVGWTVQPPEKPDDDRDPVVLEQVSGAVDAISGVMGAVLEARDGQCPSSARLFDGRRRFNLTFEDNGTTDLAKTDYGIYQGSARVCRFLVERIAGYLKRPTDWNKPEDRDRPTFVYSQTIAPDLPPLPVRVETELTLGSVVTHLVGIEPSGDWPRLAPLPTD